MRPSLPCRVTPPATLPPSSPTWPRARRRVPPRAVAVALLAGALGACAPTGPARTAGATASPMSFFVTSRNPGDGANLGGLAGADRHCQALASAVGAGDRTWHAYLSAAPAEGQPAVDARDRIGSGPWRNARGEVIARSVDDLHSASNLLNKQTALTETGQVISGRGDAVNQHDVLTGSTPDGRLATGAADTTCRNWTSNGDGSAIVGHHDRIGLRDDDASKSWNASHGTRGCSLDALKATGGAGYLYCFASR